MRCSGTYEYLDSAGAEEQARLDAVHRYQLVDEPVEETYERIAFIAAALFDTPIATVSLVEQHRIWLVAAHGLPGVREVGPEPGLCGSAIAQDGVYVVNDAATDPRTHEHPLVRGELGLRFYAGAPIRTHDGYRLGTVGVIDSRPRETTGRQLTALAHLAAAVTDELELRLLVIRGAMAEQRMRETVDD
ncbi:GAF domain-containing protein [Actinoplanes sp. NEAU-A12]|uniref:GAF domain-containing protein n=1 Tax=Actinoplanes sandaracinus TaxID=3045177 RepID=A0ABT6WM27_9ACTN|nr:GAF domain-containing protein [Actinoplanes sandaracinus]MDI6100787.1 GAF domain-containing protein [Actinoplanes sandaracinus]